MIARNLPFLQTLVCLPTESRPLVVKSTKKDIFITSLVVFRSPERASEYKRVEIESIKGRYCYSTGFSLRQDFGWKTVTFFPMKK